MSQYSESACTTAWPIRLEQRDRFRLWQHLSVARRVRRRSFIVDRACRDLSPQTTLEFKPRVSCLFPHFVHRVSFLLHCVARLQLLLPSFALLLLLTPAYSPKCSKYCFLPHPNEIAREHSFLHTMCSLFAFSSCT